MVGGFSGGDCSVVSGSGSNGFLVGSSGSYGSVEGCSDDSGNSYQQWLSVAVVELLGSIQDDR